MQLVPHAPMIVALACALGFLALLIWNEHRQCTCRKDRGTFLKPRWKRYDRKGK